MKYLLPAILAVFALAGLAGPSEARMNPSKAQTKMRAMSPEEFAKRAAASNQFEIASSQLALDKSKNDEIRRFAQRMIEDHTKLSDRLKTTLQQANLPEAAVQLSPALQAQLNKLRSQKEAAFDRTYAADQRKDHVQVLHLLENYAKRGDNTALKEFASNGIPLIKEHLKLAEGLRAGRNLSARR